MTSNSAKRPLNSPDDTRDPKKVNQQTQDSISDQLKAIRVSCSQENSSYIPSNQQEQQAGPRYRPTSEFSFGGNWDRGTTDVINIEILSINGEDFKGSYKRPEALYIWSNVLGMSNSQVHGISFKSMPRKNLQIVYRLKESISIDTAFERDDFSYNRGEKRPDGSYDIVCGRIMVIRKKNPRPEPVTSRPERPTRVNLYGCEFDLKKEQIMNWMAKFGEILHEPEDILDRECPEIATGDISIILKLHKHIPSFLPMYGKKIRVAYRGMTTICSNCFDVNHMRVECDNQRANYLDYVHLLIESGRFEPELFGNWISRVKKYREFKDREKSKNKNPPKSNLVEESYVEIGTEAQEKSKEKEVDEDTNSVSSFKSTETILDNETQMDTNEKNTTPKMGVFESVMAKFTSTETRSTQPK